MTHRWRNTIRVLAFLAMATLASSCVTWHPIAGPLPVATESKPDPVVQLNLWNGSMVTMYSPQFKDDSIVGYDQPSTQHATNRIAILKTDVITTRVGKFDFGKTLAYGVLGYVTLSLLALLALAGYESY